MSSNVIRFPRADPARGIVRAFLDTRFAGRVLGVQTYVEAMEMARSGALEPVRGTLTLREWYKYQGPDLSAIRSALCWHFELRHDPENSSALLLDLTNGEITQTGIRFTYRPAGQSAHCTITSPDCEKVNHYRNWNLMWTFGYGGWSCDLGPSWTEERRKLPETIPCRGSYGSLSSRIAVEGRQPGRPKGGAR